MQPIIASLLVVLAVAAAQTRDENWKRCSDPNGDVDLMIGACTALIQSGRETTENLATSFYNRGTAFGKKNDNDKALENFNQAITLKPNYASAFYNRGVIHKRLGHVDLAKGDYDSAITFDPSKASAFNNRGNIYRDKGQYDLAIRDHNEAIRIEATPNRYVARGNDYFEKGQHAQALTDYDEAVRRDPNYAEAFNNRCAINTDTLSNRGLAYLSMKNDDAAIAAYEAALKVNPKLPFALFGHGVAKRNKGNAAGGDADIAAAKAIQSDIADQMTKYGIRLPAK